MEPPDPTPAPEDEIKPGYLRRNGLAVAVIAVFAALGFYFGPEIAPNMPVWRSRLAGSFAFAFGGGAAVLNRLLR